jgi:hypothetical protein
VALISKLISATVAFTENMRRDYLKTKHNNIICQRMRDLSLKTARAPVQSPSTQRFNHPCVDDSSKACRKLIISASKTDKGPKLEEKQPRKPYFH